MTKPFEREVLMQTVNRHRRGEGSAQVLVVDDDPRSRDMLRRTLQKEGWTVAEAVNGREAPASSSAPAGAGPARSDDAGDGWLRGARADAARRRLARHPG